MSESPTRVTYPLPPYPGSILGTHAYLPRFYNLYSPSLALFLSEAAMLPMRVLVLTDMSELVTTSFAAFTQTLSTLHPPTRRGVHQQPKQPAALGTLLLPNSQLHITAAPQSTKASICYVWRASPQSSPARFVHGPITRSIIQRRTSSIYAECMRSLPPCVCPLIVISRRRCSGHLPTPHRCLSTRARDYTSTIFRCGKAHSLTLPLDLCLDRYLVRAGSCERKRVHNISEASQKQKNFQILSLPQNDNTHTHTLSPSHTHPYILIRAWYPQILFLKSRQQSE